VIIEYYISEIEIVDEDRDRAAKKIEIKWQFNVEHRSWGVKSIYIIVPDQNLQVCWSQENPVTGDCEDVDETVEIKDCEVEFDIAVTGETIYPSELVVSDGKFTLRFFSERI
jgi:hypothetical protein